MNTPTRLIVLFVVNLLNICYSGWSLSSMGDPMPILAATMFSLSILICGLGLVLTVLAMVQVYYVAQGKEKDGP